MKKRLSLYARSIFSALHTAFVKILNIHSFKSSFIQDFSLTTKLSMRDGGGISLAKHIHTKRNVVFEADGGKIEIGEGCFMNNGCMVVAKEHIRIGAYTSFGPNVLVYDHDHDIHTDKSIHDSGYKTAPVIIGKNVWVGANTVILRGSIIGDGCVIGAGSVIKGEYEAGSVVIQRRGEEIGKRKEVHELA